MNKDFWERIDRLEELAGKATQGEWDVYNLSKVFSVEGGNNLFQAYSGFDSEGHKWDGKVNALYIAAANPAMILEMITELRKLTKQVNWLAMKCQNVRKFPTMNGKPEDDWTAYKWREAARKVVMEERND